MNFLQIISESGWFPAVVTAIISSIVTYAVTKNNNKKDISISDVSDRIQLSKDQLDLISELREMIADQKTEIKSMRAEMEELQKVNIKLMFHNKELQHRITELSLKIDNFTNNKGGE